MTQTQPRKEKDWKKEAEGMAIVIPDGALKGCVVYHEAIVTELIPELLASLTKAHQEEMEKAKLEGHEMAHQTFGRAGALENESVMEYRDRIANLLYEEYKALSHPPHNQEN